MTDASSERTDIKVVLIGETNVGKTSLVKRELENTFTKEYTPTVGALYSVKPYHFNSQTVNLRIWDTAGAEAYKAMAPLYYRNARVAIVVYSVTDSTTFEAVDEWFASLREFGDGDVMTFVVANKVDLADVRKVTTEAGTAKAKEFGAQFSEVSALTGYGVGELFASIPTLYLERTQNVVPVAVNPLAGVPISEVDNNKKRGCC
jgi:Ras-related protein Rab-5C